MAYDNAEICTGSSGAPENSIAAATTLTSAPLFEFLLLPRLLARGSAQQEELAYLLLVED